MVFYKNFLTTLGADSIALVALAAIVYNFDCHRYHLPHSTRLLFCPLRSDGKTFWACSRLWILREEACYALLVCLPFSLNGHVVNLLHVVEQLLLGLGLVSKFAATESLLPYANLTS